MFGDLWDDNENKTRKSILLDFDQKIDKSKIPLRVKKIGQAEAIMKIERFVSMVLQSKKPAYAFRRKAPDCFKETYIGQRMKEILPLAMMFDSHHLYSEKPAIFLRAFWLINRIYGFRLSKPMYRVILPDVHRAEVMNLLIEQIRFEAQGTWFQRFVYDKKYEAKERAEALVAYTMAILRYYAKTLVVRVDFGYLGGASASITIDRVLYDLHYLLESRENHKLFKHLIGYGWTVEQKGKKGFHIHAMFFFNGSEVRQDVTLGFAIGNLWSQEITNGKGTFNNCNAKKEKYERCGIGMIHRSNEQECANTIEFMQYIAKGGPFLDRDDQYLRIKPFGARTFGTGQAPDMDPKRGGRPAAPAPWLDAHQHGDECTSVSLSQPE